MNPLAIFNQENVTKEEVKSFRHRKAVRGIVFDADENVALLHIQNENYYELPGGGVDGDETYEQAVIRECKEEVGCDVEITKYIGTTFEYRKQNNLLNESWGYIVKAVGEKGSPLLAGDETEAEKNSSVIWVPLLEVIRLFESTPARPELYDQYCIDRDLAFLKASKE